MLTQLQLKSFRCFESLTLEPGAGFTFFIGGNGEGKTSILEAACVLLRLQSQRSATLSPLVRVGAKAFAVRGRYDEHALEFSYGGLHRRLKFDKVDQRTATEYLHLARVVSFANIDIELVRGGSDTRRRYLDFLGSQIEPTYRPTLRAYERALRSRNALLKSAAPRPREIAAYDAPLIENGTRLRDLRLRIVERLAPFVAQAHHEISVTTEKIDMYFSPGVGSQAAGLTGTTSGSLVDSAERQAGRLTARSAETADFRGGEDFAKALADSREKELRLRQTVVGPHRDEVDLFVDGMPANSFGSEGQQRTLALALKIAQARVFAAEGSTPLLLIDDIFGELDSDRRNALLRSLPNDSQKFVTATTLQWRRDFAEGVVFQLQDRQLRRS